MWPIRPIGPKYRICVIHWHTIELVHDTKNNNTITCAHSKGIDQIERQPCQPSQRIVFAVHSMVAKVVLGFSCRQCRLLSDWTGQADPIYVLYEQANLLS